MGQDVDAYIAFGVEVPDFIGDPYELISTAKDALKEKHGNPSYFYQTGKRPSRDDFDSHQAWRDRCDELKQEWYRTTDEGARRKAFEDEWEAIGIATEWGGCDTCEDHALVDKHTLIHGGWEGIVTIDKWPQCDAKDFKHRLARLFELAGVSFELKQEPHWMLLARLW